MKAEQVISWVGAVSLCTVALSMSPVHADAAAAATSEWAPPGAEPVAQGPFQPDWESLKQYKVPDWFRDAKFGIWAHWTAQCVPEQGDWYARNMYIQYTVDKKTGQNKPNPDYAYQVAHYGHPSKVGFKDIDHLWKAENWDPEQLMQLYKKAGAKYFFALANHHDNLDCFDSKYQPWNTMKVGPGKDIVGMWEKAARAQGLRFGVSVHAARTWSWFDVSHGADVDGPLKGVPYDGNLLKSDGAGQWWDGLDPADLYGPAGAARTEAAHDAYDLKFFNRTMDLINKYHPDVLYFDDGVLPLRDKPQLGLKIAAHYYNSDMQQHGGKLEAVMNTKGLNEEQRQCLVWDIERGKSDKIEPEPWQTDTCIGGWHYSRALAERHGYKKPAEVIQMLVDIVSKNGNLMLSVPLRANGLLDDDEIKFLQDMAPWMEVNGEAIFGSRPWTTYGEGPSTTGEQEKGHFGGLKDVGNFSSEDIRFTTKGDVLYAIVLGIPSKELRIKSLGSAGKPAGKKVADVALLGSNDKIAWKQEEDTLVVQPASKWPCEHAVAFKVTLQIAVP